MEIAANTVSRVVGTEVKLHRLGRNVWLGSRKSKCKNLYLEYQKYDRYSRTVCQSLTCNVYKCI